MDKEKIAIERIRETSERMIEMLDEKKAEIAKRVKEKFVNEAEASGKNEHSSDPCDGCPVGGGCIYTECGSRGHTAG